MTDQPGDPSSSETFKKNVVVNGGLALAMGLFTILGLTLVVTWLDPGLHTLNDVRNAVANALEGLHGCVRVTLEGEVGPAVRVDSRELQRLGSHLDGLVVRTGQLGVAYDLERILAEETVRGEFARDAYASIHDEEERRRVLFTGLRALEGRADLEVA